MPEATADRPGILRYPRMWPRPSMMITALLVAAASCGPAAPGGGQEPLPLVPRPAVLERNSGFLALPDTLTVGPVTPATETLVSQAVALLAEHGLTGITDDAPLLDLRITDSGGAAASESYRLAITDHVEIAAAGQAGGYYALQTLGQLLSADQTRLPRVLIEDAPRFSYRGVHLDVARHFFPVLFVKRYIDLISRYKFNTFHWHLTEDQGWRMAIERYPRLTEVGGCRRETMVEKNFDPFVGDSTPVCGYYTQDEVREIVAYAAERNVTVIPEIEMPGHSLAALASYPHLACTPGPFEVGTRWGVFEDIYCPSEATFEFLQGVLTEVMDLFPSRYIHIGGDEAPKRRWRESALAQQVIAREGLVDEAELQSYFIRRIERFLNDNGRRLIGWDEILEGGLAPDATVMSWRGTAGGIAAAREGHQVIMTPGSHLYFDHYQGDPEFEPLAIGGHTSLEKVYHFDPVPAELDSTEANMVLGAQANLWTEYMKTGEHVEYMLFPRLLALAEVVWSPAAARDWQDFRSRLPGALRQLDALEVNYRIPDPEGLEGDRIALTERYTLMVTSPIPHATVRYTVNGTEPDGSSASAEGAIVVHLSDRDTVELRARLEMPDGRLGPQKAIAIRAGELLASSDPGPVAPGVTYRYVEGTFRRVADLAAAATVRQGTSSAIALPGWERDEGFGLEFEGWLEIPEDGVFQFSLLSDDGSTLELSGVRVIDHDGLHSARERLGSVALAAGYHRLAVRYLQAGGSKALAVSYRRDGTTEWRSLENLLWRAADQTR